MNPNMKYAQMIPYAPYKGNASQMYFDVGQEGFGIGIEDFSSEAIYMIESINLLEQLPKVQTDMSDDQKKAIADAVTSVKTWM
jgi:hypothetical protein